MNWSKNLYNFFFSTPFSFSRGQDPLEKIYKKVELGTYVINPVATLSQNLLKWETSFKKAQQAEITYQRIEQIITNIKSNLVGFSLGIGSSLNQAPTELKKMTLLF